MGVVSVCPPIFVEVRDPSDLKQSNLEPHLCFDHEYEIGVITNSKLKQIDNPQIKMVDIL